MLKTSANASAALFLQVFDLIGTEFHRWVRDHEDSLGLKASQDFARFIERDFDNSSPWV